MVCLDFTFRRLPTAAILSFTMPMSALYAGEPVASIIFPPLINISKGPFYFAGRQTQ